MNQLDRKRAIMTKTDLILIGVVLFLFVILLLVSYSGDTGKLYAVVTVDGRVLHRIDLERVAEPYTITVEGDYPCELLIENGAVTVVSAECPDKVCQNAGRLTRVGTQAVCLPNRMAVRIEGQSTQNTLDAITE